MSFQGNFNNNLIGIAAAASLVAINNSIKELGFANSDDLTHAINELKIAIADCKDRNIDCANKEQLLKEYIEVKNKYDEEVRKQQEKQRKTGKTLGIIFLGGAIVCTIIMIVTLCMMC